jgi:hypothetical protein
MARKSRSSSTSHWSIARTLAAIGAIIALVGFAIGFVEGFTPNVRLPSILYALVGIIVSVFVLLQIDLVQSWKLNIPFNWWLLLIFVVIQAVVSGAAETIVGLAGLGVLLELIAVIFLLVDVL